LFGQIEREFENLYIENLECEYLLSYCIFKKLLFIHRSLGEQYLWVESHHSIHFCSVVKPADLTILLGWSSGSAVKNIGCSSEVLGSVLS
jgi:hypothetical protein